MGKRYKNWREKRRTVKAEQQVELRVTYFSF